jgi:hypothetical protein
VTRARGESTYLGKAVAGWRRQKQEPAGPAGEVAWRRQYLRVVRLLRARGKRK